MELTAIAAWLNTAWAGFDQAAAVAVHQLYETAGGFFTPVLVFISFLGKGGACLIVFSFGLCLFPKTRRFGTAMLLGLAVGALITNLCLKPLVLRPRPYTQEGSVYYQYWLLLGQHMESDFSFPSGHTTAAMAVSMAVFLVGDRRWSWTAFLFTIAMGVSRIYLSVHYASDVLGGVLAGGIGGAVGYTVTLFLPAGYYTADLRRLGSGSRGRHQGG